MQKFVTLDYQTITDWQNAFKLNHDWKGKSPSIIAATLALSTLDDMTPPGYYLARQKLEVKRLPPLNQELILKGAIIKTKANFITCRSVVASGSEIIITLYSTLIKTETGAKIKTAKTQTLFYDEADYRRTFTKSEVNTFSLLSGDQNTIHSGDDPVVQGMLILLVLEDYMASNGCVFENVDIRYIEPVRINEAVKLHKQSNTLDGIVDDKIYFKLNF